MTAPATRAPAHLQYIVDAAVKNLMARPIITPADREDREAACLALLTDAQALATWERMKAVRKAYVEAIIEKVPA